jgi:hypothetical protein
MVLIVAYDLHQPGRDYDRIAAALQQADWWAHPQGSVWFLDTMLSPTDWVNRLRAVGDPNDEYFVSRLQRQQWASWNMGQAMVNWLNDPTRRW